MKFGTNGEIGGKLESDHLVPKEPLRPTSETEELLKLYFLVDIHDINNGLTLCGSCHYLRGAGAMWFDLAHCVYIDATKLLTDAGKRYKDHLMLQEGKKLLVPSEPEMLNKFPRHALMHRVGKKK